MQNTEITQINIPTKRNAAHNRLRPHVAHRLASKWDKLNILLPECKGIIEKEHVTNAKQNAMTNPQVK